MSWYGIHPRMSKAEARRQLPLGSCKLCVYRYRCFLPNYGCNRCGSHRSVRHAPFNEYQSDLFKILGSIQQSGRYLYQVDLPKILALRGLIYRKIVTFKEMMGNLAVYIPLVGSYYGFDLRSKKATR